jgi:serine/threonine-protein kinase
LTTPLDKFLELVQKSGLASSTETVAWRAEFPFTLTDEFAVEELCLQLIGKGVLTTWQCDKLRQGKWKGFFLDGYCFLSRISMDDTSSTYLCREVATQKYVAMRVTPPHFSTDESFRYEIHDPPPDVVPKS